MSRMNKTKLQVALDFLDLDRAMAVAKQAVAGGADYIEAGTPLIKSVGLDAVRRLREAFPDKTIIADMKTADAGKVETEAAAKAGADIVTVLASAPADTIAQCVEAGEHYGVKVAVDLIGIADPISVAEELSEMGASWIDVHCAIDSQMTGADPLDLLRKLRSKTNLILAVAGGINSETAAGAIAAGADVVIVGGAITKAVDPQKATAAIRDAIDTGKAISTDLFKRTGQEDLRKALLSVRTSNISDGAHRQKCLAGLKQLLSGSHICGQAVTVRCVPGDWAKPVEAIDVANEGDVIVVDAGGVSPAIWGELATESAKNKGIAGLVVHGAVRDTADIAKLGFPVWATEVSSHAGDPHGLGQINRPITISNQAIRPGDWIVADSDGVMVLPAERAVEMANRAADVLEYENRIREEIRQGNSTLATVVHLADWEMKSPSGIVG